MANPWRPMGQSEEDASALHEGIPPWLERSLWVWIEAAITQTNAYGSQVINSWIVDGFDQARRSTEPISHHVENGGIRQLQLRWDYDEDVIPFLDYLLAHVVG